MAIVRWLGALVCALYCALAAAQALEVIELRGKRADEVLPVLQPLLEAGGTLTGNEYQLFLKASPANRAQIKRALAALDKPARRLIIHVAQRAVGESVQAGASGATTIGTRRGASATVWDTRSVRQDDSAQQVQTVDGGRAFVQLGRALPVPLRQTVIGPGGAVVSEGVVYRDLGAGFYAMPHVNGQRVSVEISQQAVQPDPRRPAVNQTQQLATTVAGRLGEWIEVGGGDQRASQRQDAAFSVGTGDVRGGRSLWLMVEEVD